MVRKTYSNVMKATKMIMKKGYDFDEATQLAIRCFNNKIAAKNGMSVEWFINQIVDKQEWLESMR